MREFLLFSTVLFNSNMLLSASWCICCPCPNCSHKIWPYMLSRTCCNKTSPHYVLMPLRSILMFGSSLWFTVLSYTHLPAVSVTLFMAGLNLSRYIFDTGAEQMSSFAAFFRALQHGPCGSAENAINSHGRENIVIFEQPLGKDIGRQI